MRTNEHGGYRRKKESRCQPPAASILKQAESKLSKQQQEPLTGAKLLQPNPITPNLPPQPPQSNSIWFQAKLMEPDEPAAKTARVNWD